MTSAPLLPERVAALEAACARIGDERMRGLPVYNDALRVEAVDFAEEGDVWLGILVTPWFMNAVRIPCDEGAWADREEGEVVERTLPSGRYDFTVVRLAGVGPFETCSLISPMASFVDPHVAHMVAVEARAELMRPAVESEAAPVDDEAPRARRPVSRRGLLRGRLVGGG